MKNLVIVHGIGGIEREMYFQHLKSFCENLGLKVFMPSLGSYRNGATYELWKKYFDENIASHINSDTIFVGQSVGTNFAIKYLVERNLNPAVYISMAGPYDILKFRTDAPESTRNFAPYAKTFKPSQNEFDNFKTRPFAKYSLFCDNDTFFEQSNLENYSEAIGSNAILVKGKMHFGFEEVPELENLIEKLVNKTSRKLIQCARNYKDFSAKTTIYAIKKAGFDGVFIQWYNKDWDFNQQQQVDYCRQLGLDIEFAHLAYKGIDEIWADNPNGELLVENYLKDLDEIKRNNISMVVMHLTDKFIAPAPNKIGIERIQKIVDYAEKLDIKIAFENTKIFGYLEYVFDHIKNKNIGICYDSGHCHCHFNDKFNWNKFKNKILAVHLHDNDQSSDLHLLPFDGTIDWDKLLKNLKNANYQGPVTLESCYIDHYLDRSLEDFYKDSYELAKKIDKKLK